MVAYIVRFIKRLGLLIPGLLITVFAVLDIYPFIGHRIPSEYAILATYIITAYVLIPLSMRLVRIVFKARHLPLYCITPDGFASDPVNIGVVGTRNELTAAMTKAGWYQADRRTLKSIVKVLLALASDKTYYQAPFSKLYLFGRSQDIGFQLPLDDNPLHRHHVRFWAATYRVKPEFRDHVMFWRRHHQSKETERMLWVGAASLDTGIGIIRHNAQITHMIHPDTNAERRLIVRHLKKTGLVADTRTVTLGKPYQLRNRVWRGLLRTDGKMTICNFKPSRRTKPAKPITGELNIDELLAA